MKKVIHILRCVFFPFFLLPIISVMLGSVIQFWKFEELMPNSFSGRGFVYFWNSGDYKILFLTCLFSCIVAICSVILSILFSSGLIRMTKRIELRLEGFIYLPMLLPVVSICMGIHKFFLRFSDVTTLNIFIMHVYFSLPYAFLVVYAAYKENGRKWMLISKNLGITDFQTLLYVEFPMIKENLYSAFLFAFSVSYGQYFVNVFLGDYNDVNFSMVLAPYLQTSNRNIGSVYILMYLLAGIVVTSFVRKGLKKWRV